MGERYQIRPIVTWTDPVTEDRQSSGVFRATWENTVALLEDEAGRLDVQGPIVMQIDVQQPDIRADGMLRARAKVGNFPGVAVSRHPLLLGHVVHPPEVRGGDADISPP